LEQKFSGVAKAISKVETALNDPGFEIVAVDDRRVIKG